MFEFEGGDGETILMNPAHIVAIYPEVYKLNGEIVTESVVSDALGNVWHVKGTVREIKESLRLAT